MVFVTGGSGLIGSYLLLELSKRGKKIRVLKRKNSNLEGVKKLFSDFSSVEIFDQIQWVEGDLLDITSLPELIKGCDTIYHTAGQVEFDDRLKKSIELINVIGTEDLVNAALSAKIPNFVYVSSISVLDASPGEKIITEKSSWNMEFAHSEYARSKKKAEMEVWRGSEEGLNVLVLYPSVVIGSLDGKRESEKIFSRSLKPKSYATKGITGFVDVRDVSFLMAELAEKGKWGKRFILNSQDKSYQEVFDIIRTNSKLDKTKILSKTQLKLLYCFSFLSGLFGGKHLSKSNYYALTNNSTYSNSKIKNSLSFEFIPVKEALLFHSERYLNYK